MLPDRNFLYYNFGFGGFIFFLPAQLAHGPQSKYITAQIRPKSDNNHRSFNIRWNFNWHELDTNLRDEFQDQERVHQCRIGRRRRQSSW
jgi:hypothetical protein